MMAHDNKNHSSGWKNPNRIMNRKISGLLVASPRLMTMSVMEKRFKVNQMVCFFISGEPICLRVTQFERSPLKTE